MSDQELVIAQGQENNERQDLSYIVKSSLRATPRKSSYPRDVIMSALAIYKSDRFKHAGCRGVKFPRT